jgi:hypothetical protein
LEEGGWIGGCDRAGVHLGPQVVKDACRGRDAYVRQDKGFLELLEGRLVDPLATADPLEVTGEQPPGAAEAVT